MAKTTRSEQPEAARGPLSRPIGLPTRTEPDPRITRRSRAGAGRGTPLGVRPRRLAGPVQAEPGAARQQAKTIEIDRERNVFLLFSLDKLDKTGSMNNRLNERE